MTGKGMMRAINIDPSLARAGGKRGVGGFDCRGG